MLRVALAIALFASLCGGPLAAQVPELPAPFVTVDQERLFAESAFGRRAIAEIERRSRALAAENRRIEAELVAEERALTELRPTLPHAEFRTRAEAFDAKVQQLRAEQDQKEVEVSALRDGAQAVFFARVGPVLGEVIRERGAVAILDRRVVILAVDSIDVTEAAIARIDAVLGDGAGLWPAEEAAEGAAKPPIEAEAGSAAVSPAAPETGGAGTGPGVMGQGTSPATADGGTNGATGDAAP